MASDNSASLEKPEPMRCPTCGDISAVRYENIGDCKDAWHDPDSPAPSSSPLETAQVCQCEPPKSADEHYVCPVHPVKSPEETPSQPAYGMDFWWEKWLQDNDWPTPIVITPRAACEFAQWFAQQCAETRKQYFPAESSPKPPELRHTCVEPDNDMEEQYCAACENLSVADWVVERHENCIRIAGEKTGLDRDGWLNDAHYFRQIIESLQATPSAEPKPAKSPDMVWVNRAEYNSLRECMIEAADEIQRLRTPSPEPPRQTGYESMDLVEPICRAICKVEALNPDEPQDSEQEPNWVRYADAVQQTLLSAKVSPERTCSMHGELCLDASVHHFLKYHDPRSDFYIGTGCGKCAYSEVEKLRESPRQSQESYWCCKADFGQHEPTCKNAPSSHSEPELVKELISASQQLLEWQPICSKGSSGELRQNRVRAALAKFGGDGSLKQAIGVEADLKHPGNDTGGKTANHSELVKLREAIGYIRGLLNENRPNGETVLKIRGYVTGVEIALSAALASTPQNEKLSSGEAK